MVQSEDHKVFYPPICGQPFTRLPGCEGAAGVDHVTIDMFTKQLDQEIDRLSQYCNRRNTSPKP